MKKLLSTWVLILAVLGVMSAASAQGYDAFLRIQISGSQYVPGDAIKSDDETMIYGYHHQMAIPFDPQTGNIVGSPVYAPVYVVKKINAGSVSARTLHAQGSHLQSSRIRFERYNPQTAMMEDYLTITLEDVIIGNIETFALDRTYAFTHHGQHYERYEINFLKIRWRWEAKGVEFEWDFLQNQSMSVQDGVSGLPPINVAAPEGEIFGFELFKGIDAAELFRVVEPN